ncbi:bifunctional YncE family protein/alkaline phosphatase family protein [Flexivirga sp. ID2601S]|uniref:Bifunctional YncE family protein/alkaline phosphatase family protein n=1 Tax=Flexivirga aerilata TaxID=1656889 RepID=A0A849AK57_9MICO|nr:bifunctional YncE family protein/alkaline phosphatase family protein [Flexivirga aerilata]NNG41214.1 bifunctional YncE family protein/alkaline phosphatase family protein [Flexivirga aerilata]
MHVTRQRRSAPQGPRKLTGRRLRLAVAGAAALTVAGGGLAAASTSAFKDHQVGSTYADGLQVSSNQVIKPIGERLLTESGKFMGSTVSPDQRYLAASSADRKVSLQIVDLSTYKVIWKVGTAAGVNQRLSDLTVGQEGPTYSPDGKVLWLPQKNGLTRFPVNPDGTLGAPTTVKLPKDGDKSALPAQSTYSADGKTLYVALNGQNAVAELDPATGAVRKKHAVGIAPRQITVVGGKIYVSNEGGRPAKSGETTINSYGTQVPADPYLGTSTTGTVSVIDATSGAVKSIDVGLHPTALHTDGKALFVANTGSDTVSVINTGSDKVVQTVNTQPYASSKVGYEPTSIAVQNGKLLVSLGRANAVAVFNYAGNPQEPVGLVGLLPTDYFPMTLATVGKQVVVTNTRGIDARGPAVTINKGPQVPVVSGHGTHSTTASLTRFTLPSDTEIKKATKTVFDQNGWGNNDVQQATGNRQAAVPVPAKIGDPSTIKHVFLLVKENRTYDQVYGDDPRGNGDPSLAQFGKQVTPNQHNLAKQFGLYDNVYDIGTNSAEGHNWLMQGDNPAYTESSAGEYERSYDTEDDVLGHQRSGFLWTSVESAKKSARNFGEFTQFLTKPAGADWQSYYCAAKGVEGGADPSTLTTPALKSDTSSPIPSLNDITVHDYPKFDTEIPDIYRYQIWKKDFEKNGPANLNMFWLSSDHTGGAPSSRAQVADGDLAVGKIVDQISHSKYWKDSAIFVVEDDSQDGADHVDGHRAPVQVISPWAKHGTVNSTFYSQINMVRTIQQILGAQPLNQKLAAATPMYDAFTKKPDFTPYTATPNQVPLTESVTPPPACGPDTPAGTAGAAAKPRTVPKAQQATAAAWESWRTKQSFTGPNPTPDSASPELMNRFTWYQANNWSKPYPGDQKIYTPSQVPGGYLPSNEVE